MYRQLQLKALVIAALLVVIRAEAFAWNIPGHMITGAIAYRLLHRRSQFSVANIQGTLQQLVRGPLVNRCRSIAGESARRNALHARCTVARRH